MRKIGVMVTSGLLLSLALVALAATTGWVLSPVADAIPFDWTPLTGTSHVAMVNNVNECDKNATYNWTRKVRAMDMYHLDFSGIPNGATINQIQIDPCASGQRTGISYVSTMDVGYRAFEEGQLVSEAFGGNYQFDYWSGTTPAWLTTSTFNVSIVKGQNTQITIGPKLTGGDKGEKISAITAKIFFSL